MLKQFINSLTENFRKRLSAKTGWGRNEILSEFTNAVVESFPESSETKQDSALRKDMLHHFDLLANGTHMYSNDIVEVKNFVRTTCRKMLLKYGDESSE